MTLPSAKDSGACQPFVDVVIEVRRDNAGKALRSVEITV